MNTTTDQIRALLAGSTERAESASSGLHIEGGNTIYDAHGCAVADFAYSDMTTDDDEANAEFFAAARTDLPARDRMGLIALDALIEARDALFDFQASDAGMKVNVALAAMLTALQGETDCMHCGRPAGEHCGNHPGTPEGACKSDAGDVEHPWRDTKFTAMQGEGGAR